jgi:hypothetical protein
MGWNCHAVSSAAQVFGSVSHSNSSPDIYGLGYDQAERLTAPSLGLLINLKTGDDQCRNAPIQESVSSTPANLFDVGADEMIERGRCLLYCMSPLLADSVAKVPKRRATKFPLNDKTSGNRRSM